MQRCTYSLLFNDKEKTDEPQYEGSALSSAFKLGLLVTLPARLFKDRNPVTRSPANVEAARKKHRQS